MYLVGVRLYFIPVLCYISTGHWGKRLVFDRWQDAIQPAGDKKKRTKVMSVLKFWLCLVGELFKIS